MAYALEVQGDAEAVSKMENFDQALDKTGQTTEATAKKTEALKPALGQAALGFSAAAAGAFALYTQYDGLEKRQLAVDRANKQVEVSNLSLSRAQEALAKLQAEGSASALDLEQAQRQVNIEMENVRLATEKARLAQGDYSQAQMGFALSVMPTVVGVITGATGALKALGIVTTITNVETGASVTVFSGAAASKLAHAAATGIATAATGALTLATKLLHVAMGPVGWILLGIGAAFAALATNAFGVRDAINSLGVKLGELVPWLRPVLEAIGTLGSILFPETQEASAELATGVNMNSAQMTADINTMVEEHKSKLQEDAGAFDSLGAKVDSVRENMAQDFKVGKILFDEARPKDLMEATAMESKLKLEIPDLEAELEAKDALVLELKPEFEAGSAEITKLQQEIDSLQSKIRQAKLEIISNEDAEDQSGKQLVEELKKNIDEMGKQIEIKRIMLEEAQFSFSGLVEPFSQATAEAEKAKQVYEDALEVLAEKQKAFAAAQEELAKSDFRLIPSAIGAPVALHDPLFGSQRISEITSGFQESAEKQKAAADEINAKYREIFPQITSYHIELSEQFGQNTKDLEEFKNKVATETTAAKESVATNIGAVTTEFAMLQVESTRMQDYVSSQFRLMAGNIDDHVDAIVSDAGRAIRALEDLKDAGGSLGGASRSGSAGSSGSGGQQPITIILQVDGQELARKTMNGSGTLKFI